MGLIDARLFNTLEWRLVGPHRGGRVVAVAGHPTETGTFYFGAVAGGVWKTTDAGAYWENISDGYFNTAAIGALAVSESDPNVIYAGTGETSIRGNVSHGDGVYKSTDGGKTWRNVGLEDTRHIGRVRIHPQNPDIVYIATLGHAWGRNEERGVFRTTDGGQNWEKVLYKSDKAGAIDLSMDVNNPRVLYATFWEAQRHPHQLVSGGEGSGIWKSVDGGDTWEDITRNPGLPQEGVLGKIGVAVSGADSNRVWALIEHDEGAMFRSDDAGATWEKVSDNPDLRRRAWYFMHIYADPTNRDTVWVLNLQCWKSIDGGSSYEEIPTPHGDNQDLWIDPKNSNRMIEGNDGGACVSLNGARTWSSIYNQPTAQFYHATTDSQVPYRLYGSQQDNWAISVPSLSFDGAISEREWVGPGGGESGYIAVSPVSPNLVFGGAVGMGPGPGKLISYDPRTGHQRDIAVWPEDQGYASGAESHRYRFQWTYPVEISPHDPGVLYVCSNHVHKSTDSGSSWEVISPDLTRNDRNKQKPSGGPISKDNTGAEMYCTIFAFHESPQEEGVFWAGSDDGLIHISRDGGENWENVTPSADLLPEWALISIIEISPHDPATAYVAATRYKHDDTKPYLLKTNNYGLSWQCITNGILEDDFTRTIREDPNRRGLLYAGTETGVYVSFDDGENWQRFQLNLPVVPIHDLVVKDADLVAATHGRAFWILDDLTPLHQMADETRQATLHLFAPRQSYRFRIYKHLGTSVWRMKPSRYTQYAGLWMAGPGGAAFDIIETADGRITERFLDAGHNPPDGVIIYFYLKEQPAGEVVLNIRDGEGNLVNSFSSATSNETEPRLPANAGINRFVWDMGFPKPKTLSYVAEGLLFRRPPYAPKAPSGTYEAELVVNGATDIATFEIVPDPRLPVSEADLRAQFELMVSLRDKISEISDALNQANEAHAQIVALEDRTRGGAQFGDLLQFTANLKEKLKVHSEALRDETSSRAFIDGGNNRVREKLVSLANIVDNADAKPTSQAYEVFSLLSDQADGYLAQLRQVFEVDIPDLNRQAQELGVPGVALCD